jgi:hypothetical protein
MALIFCPECGTQVSEMAIACPKCAFPISKINFRYTNTGIGSEQNAESINTDIGTIEYYYEQEFKEIQNLKETYKGRWNWNAFFFTWIWLFLKGCWAIGLVVLFASCFLSFYITVMIDERDYELALGAFGGALAVNIILGMRGTWFYYNVKVKNKQFII